MDKIIGSPLDEVPLDGTHESLVVEVSPSTVLNSSIAVTLHDSDIAPNGNTDVPQVLPATTVDISSPTASSDLIDGDVLTPPSSSVSLWNVVPDIGTSVTSSSLHILACGGDYSSNLKTSVWGAIQDLPTDMNIPPPLSTSSPVVPQLDLGIIAPPESTLHSSCRRHSAEFPTVRATPLQFDLSSSQTASHRLMDTCRLVRSNLDRLRTLRITTESLIQKSKDISFSLDVKSSSIDSMPRTSHSLDSPQSNDADPHMESSVLQRIRAMSPFLDRIAGSPLSVVFLFARPPFVLFEDEVVSNALISLPLVASPHCEHPDCSFCCPNGSYTDVLQAVLQHYLNTHYITATGMNLFCGICRTNISDHYLVHSCYLASPAGDCLLPAPLDVESESSLPKQPVVIRPGDAPDVVDSSILEIGPVSCSGIDSDLLQAPSEDGSPVAPAPHDLPQGVSELPGRLVVDSSSVDQDDGSILDIGPVLEELSSSPIVVSPPRTVPDSFIVRPDSSLLVDNIIPTSYDLLRRFDDVWHPHKRVDCFRDGPIIHSLFPRTNTLPCDFRGCSYVAHGFTWDLSLAALVNHLEIEHSTLIIECFRWCSICRTRFTGHPSSHSCLAQRKRWYIPLKTGIPWTCYLCDFSNCDKNVVRDHLSVAHLISPPSSKVLPLVPPAVLPSAACHSEVPPPGVGNTVPATVPSPVIDHSVTDPKPASHVCKHLAAPVDSLPVPAPPSPASAPRDSSHVPLQPSSDASPRDTSSVPVRDVPDPAHLLSSTSTACVIRHDLLVTNELAILPLPLDNPLKCPFPNCDVRLTATVWTARKASLLRHVKNKHGIVPDDVKHICTLCGHFTGRLPSSHPCLSTILDSKPFALDLRLQCELCDFSTVNHFALSNHMRSHKSKQFKRNFQELTANLPTARVSSGLSFSSSVANLSDQQFSPSAEQPSTTSDEAAAAQPSPTSDEAAAHSLDSVESPDVDLQEDAEPSDVSSPVPDDSPPLVTKYYNVFWEFHQAAVSNANWTRFQEKLSDFCADVRTSLNISDFNPSSSPSQPSDLNLNDASAVQRSFRRNRRQTIRAINGEKRMPLPFQDNEVFNYFSDVWAPKSYDEDLFSDVTKHPPLAMNKFSYIEVRKALYSSENTSPGKDKISYNHLKEVDPDALLTTSILNICLKYSKIPDVWRKNLTVLIPKKELPTSPSHMRPITLLPTLYKLLSKCLVRRLTAWIMKHSVLSSSQKGFLPADGCFEHNFILERLLRLTKETSSNLYVAWLDVEAAFSTIPHAALFSVLRKYGLGNRFCSLIEDIYSQNASSIIGTSDPLRTVQVQSGVRQGCPLSGVLFALSIDPVLRKLSTPNSSLGHSALCYADDIVLLSDNQDDLQRRIDLAASLLNLLSLQLNSQKISTLHLCGRTPVGLRNTTFTLNGTPLTTISEGQFFENLGKPFIIPNLTDCNSIDTYITFAQKIASSFLAPWQKLQAFRDFLYPSLQFALRNCVFPKKELQKLDKVISRESKKILNLHHQRAPPSYIYGNRASGCIGFTELNKDHDIACLDGVFKLLTSPDVIVRTSALQDLFDLTRNRIHRDPTLQDACLYLEGTMDNDYKHTTNKHLCIWTLARKASRRLGVKWSFSAENYPIITYNSQSYSVQDRNKLMKIFRSAAKEHASASLQTSTAFGRFAECVAADPASSHFVFSGDYVSFSDWRFVHRARLGQLPLRGCRPWVVEAELRTCRNCTDDRIESTPHVLHHCMRHSRAFTHRHNSIVKRILKTAERDWSVYSMDFPVGQTSLRPDLILTRGQTALVLDITIIGENGLSSFAAAREHKKEHYSPVVDHLKAFYKTVNIDAIVLGGLGTWDPRNDTVLLKLCSKKYLSVLKKLCVSDVVSWSRRVLNEHLTGLRYYSDADVPVVPRIPPLPYRTRGSSSTPAAPSISAHRFPTYNYSDAVKSTAYRLPTQPKHSGSATSTAFGVSTGQSTTSPLEPRPKTPSSRSSVPRVTFADPLTEIRLFISENTSLPECSHPACGDTRQIVMPSSVRDAPASPDTPPEQTLCDTRTAPSHSAMADPRMVPLPPRLRNDDGILRRLQQL